MSMLREWWRHLDWFDVQRPRLWHGVIITTALAAATVLGFIVSYEHLPPLKTVQR